jgi:C1A family cysteine protease
MFGEKGTETFLKWIAGFITIFFMLLGASLAHSAEIDEIQAAINQRNATWFAEDNPISSLPREERVKLLGLLPPESKLTGMPAEVFSPAVGVILPSSLDWRDNGGNFVTPVKNQGGCGSCWAFSTTAALESRAMISFNTPGKAPNLSEQIVLSCSGAGDCQNGGSLSGASNFLVNTGTNKESYYPYRVANGNCVNAYSGWTYRPYAFSNWTSVAQDLTALKSAIASNGPVVVAMAVYTDFYYYKGGVYQAAWGYLEGYHAILAVGYNDDAPVPYFIVKNSWGTGWGASGYFKIAYSEVTTGYSDFAYQAISYGDVGLVGVNLLDPDGGELAGSGGSYPITWEAPGDAYAFNLFYSLNNGVSWNPLATDVTGSTYDWPVPVLPSNKGTCRVKIQEINGSGSKVGEDKSAGPFTIEVVGLTSPNGGELVPSGGSWEIIWTTNTPKSPVTSVKLYYTLDNGVTWKLIDTLTDNTGSYWWPVPVVAKDKTGCKVKVILRGLADKTVGSDVSASTFTVTPNPL